MTRKRKAVKKTPHLGCCGKCDRVSATLGDGVCVPCALKIKADAAAAAAPPPPEPEPVEEPPRFLGAHPGCFRCQRPGPWKVCPSCTAVLFGTPGNREGDPVLKPRCVTPGIGY